MLVPYTPLDSILDIPLSEWHSSEHPHRNPPGELEWISSNGMKITAQVDPSRWNLLVETKNLNLVLLALKIPRSRPDDRDIAALFEDIGSWVQVIDQEPSRRIAATLAAWLTAHHKTGVYEFGFLHDSPLSIRFCRQWSSSPRPRVPQALIALMEQDLLDFWARMPAPTRIAYDLAWTPSMSPPTLERHMDVTAQLATSAHERLRLMQDIQGIPFPKA